MSKSLEKREPFFDNLRAILMFLVVLCHGIETVRGYSTVIPVIHEIILCVVMWLFVFVSGYFAKSMADGNSPKRTRIINLILLYAICQFGKMPIVGTASFLRPSYANWYLLAMIVWYLLLPSIARIKPQYVLAISTICGLLICIDPKATALLQVSRLVCFFPFFLLGYYCSQRYMDAFMHIIRSKKFRVFGLVCFIIGCVFYVAFWVDIVPLGILHANKTYAEMKLTPVTGVLYRTIQYMLSAIMCFGFLAFVPRKNMIFTVIGTRTLPIYIIHTVLYAFIKRTEFFPTIGEGPGTFLVIAVMSVVVTVVCGNKWFAKVFDKFMAIDFTFLLEKKD